MPLLAGLSTYGVAVGLLIYGFESGRIGDSNAGLLIGIMIALGVVLSFATALLPKRD